MRGVRFLDVGTATVRIIPYI